MIEFQVYHEIQVSQKFFHSLQFGQEVYIVGSSPELGEWQLSKALKLKWSEGHIWKKRINVTYRANMTLPVSKFEFKFVVMMNNDPH